MEKIQSISEFIDKLTEQGLTNVDEVKGCSAEEIQKIKDGQDVALLPPLYSEMLRKLGKHAGRFQMNEDFFYPHLIHLKEDIVGAIELSQTNWQLPKDAYVFWGHNSYYYMFFRVEEGTDPPVYEFREGMKTPQKIYDYFSQFLYAIVNRK